MGKVKPRVRTSKGKKWRKGQSGSSNPQTKKHRDAAKGKFGNHLSQASSRPSSNLALTTDVLATHDAVQEDVFLIDKIDNEEDDLYVEEATSQTGISLANSSVYSLIETSNPVFGRVKRLWNSPLESHRELCAVLAAVSEVIKSKNGNDTETEYFAALLTALESSGEEKSTTAISYLLSIVMEKVPVAVLQVEFGPTCKILSSCLTSHETSNSTSLLKSLVSCLTTLLSAQPLSIWSDSYIQRILQTLMNFTVHPKPRLRKNAQRGVAAMLREGSGVMDDDNFHPSCSLVAKYCKHVLDKGGIETTALHILGLLKDCVANFPAQHIKSICESILKLITLGKSIVKITGFHSLHGLFTSKAGPQGLTSQLNGQLISALYDHQPSIVDAQLLMAWITVMESAHIRLHSLDMSICLAHVSKFFAVCCQCLLAEKTTVVKLIADIMKNLLRECLPSALNVLNGEDKEIEQKELEQKKKKSKESHEYSTILSMYRKEKEQPWELME